MVAAKRSMVSRTELQAAYAEIQRGLSSTGYSAAIRQSKQVEADLIKNRLNEGDIQPADQIKVVVLGVEGLSAVYTITSARTLTLPSGTEIPMRGILRSEVQDYLTEKFSHQVNEPRLTATTYIRVAISGAVKKPGFFQAPASALLTEEIMVGGEGPSNDARWNKSTIKRGDRIIVSGPEFALAIQKGLTLDQLNVQAGDEIVLDAKPSTAAVWRIVAGITALGGLLYFVRVL
jgi:protein involved in polysaccharide export with SLBB domain